MTVAQIGNVLNVAILLLLLLLLLPVGVDAFHLQLQSIVKMEEWCPMSELQIGDNIQIGTSLNILLLYCKGKIPGKFHEIQCPTFGGIAPMFFYSLL